MTNLLVKNNQLFCSSQTEPVLEQEKNKNNNNKNSLVSHLCHESQKKVLMSMFFGLYLHLHYQASPCWNDMPFPKASDSRKEYWHTGR